MPNGELKPQTKSDKQKRCLLCNRDDFTLNPFDQNDANDVKTLFDADIECKETRKICLHCSFQIKFIKLSAKHPNHRNNHHHQQQQQQRQRQQQNAEQREECCRELFENTVYLHEIRKKYKRYVEKFLECRRKPVKESNSSSKSNKSNSFPSPCSSCSGTISTPTKLLQSSSNLSPQQSTRSDDKSKRSASYEKSAKIDKTKINSDDGKNKVKDLTKNKTSDNEQKPEETTHNANGELKSKSNGLCNKLNENTPRTKHQPRRLATPIADSISKTKVNADECSSAIREENLPTIDQFMDDVRCKSKSKPIKIPTNTRKTVVELPKSQTKCIPPPPPIQTPTKQQKFSSFDAALSESSTLVQPYKKPTKPSTAQPSAEFVTKAPEIKTEQKQEHQNKPPNQPASTTEKKRNYTNVNGIQIELPDGVENNSEWFKCVVRLNRLKRKSNTIDVDVNESTPSAPKRQRNNRKELQNLSILTIDLNSSTELNENVTTSIESTSCFTPKSILFDSNRQQTPSTQKKRVSFYGIGAGDSSDDELIKPKKLFAKEGRTVDKKIIKEKSSDATTNVNKDDSIILPNKEIVQSTELQSPKILSLKNDEIQSTEGKSKKIDKNGSQSNLTVNSIQNEIVDKSDVIVVVPSEIINECSSSSVEPIRKKERKTNADKLTINESVKKSLNDDYDNGDGASKPIDESNITGTDTQINMSIENPSQQINLIDKKCNQTRNDDVINDCHAIESIRPQNDEKRKLSKHKQKLKQKQKLRGPRKLQKQSIIENSMTNSIVKQDKSTDMTADVGFCAIIPAIETKPKKTRKKKKSIATVNDEITATKRNEIEANVVPVDMNKIIKAVNESVIESAAVQSHEIANKFDEEVTFVNDMDPLQLETISPTIVENPFKMPEISAPVVESFDSVSLKMRICNGRVINASKTPPHNTSPNKAIKAGAMHRSPRTKKKKNDPDFIESDELSPAEELADEMATETKKRKFKSMPKRRKLEQTEQNELHSYPPVKAAKKNLRGQFGDRIFDAYVKLNRNPNIDQALYGDGSVVVRFETPNVGLPHGMQYINQTVNSPHISNEAQIVSNDCDTSYSNADVNMENATENTISENITENVQNMENMENVAIIENHETYEPDSVTTIQTDEYSLNYIQEPLISVGNSCIGSPMIPILSEIEPNGIGFESPTATVDSTTSGYSSATTASTISSLELVPAQFHIGTNEVAISINNYVTNNINSSHYDDESSGIYFSNLNMANCVGIGSSLEQINADDIISVLGKPIDSNELNMDDGIGMGAFDTTSPTNHVVSRNYYLNDYNPLNAFNSGHSMSTPNGIVFRTKASLKQIDIPGLGSLNDSYCNDLSSRANELSTKLLRNDNPLLNHHSNGYDETAIEIREASSSFSTVADSMVTSSETAAVSPLPSIRRSGLNISISTPTKGTAHGADLHSGDMLFDIFEENQRELLNAENFPTTTTPVEPPFDLNSYNY